MQLSFAKLNWPSLQCAKDGICLEIMVWLESTVFPVYRLLFPVLGDAEV